MKCSKRCFGVLVVGLLLGALAYLDVVDYFTNLNWHLNMSFWAAIISSFITITGVFITLKAQESQFKQQIESNKQQFKQEIEANYEKAKLDLVNSYRPFLQYFISIGVFPYRNVQSQRTAILDYELDFKTSGGKEAVIPLDVKNIGTGIAIIKKVTVTDKKTGKTIETDSIRDKVIANGKSSVFNIRIKNVKNFKDLQVTLSYEDLFNTKYEDVFDVEDCFKIYDANLALKRYLDKQVKQGNINKLQKYRIESSYRKEIEGFIAEKNYLVNKIQNHPQKQIEIDFENRGTI